MSTLDYFDMLLQTAEGYNKKYPKGNTPYLHKQAVS